MADLQTELRESIAYFEQILHVLPEDRTALEFLCVACAQLGEQEKFLKYAMDLAEIVLREKNAESAADLIEKLKSSQDPRAQATVLKLQVLATPKPDLTYEKTERLISSAVPSVAAQAEIALLERLIADGVLRRSLVTTAFEQLEQLPATDKEFLISALLILEKENLTGAVDALVAVADAAHAPPIPLESFEISPAFVRRLPRSLVRVRGVVPFAQLGREWAVAVMNPLDDELRREVAEVLGGKCHFFLAPPLTIESVLDRLLGAETTTLTGAPTDAVASAGENPSVPPPVVTSLDA